MEADVEYDEEIEIEGGPQAQNRWTGGTEPVPVEDEDGQRTRRVVTHSEIEGELHWIIVIPSTCPDAFVATLAANISKATQHGRTQDTVPIGSGPDVSAVVPGFYLTLSLPDHRRPHLGAQVERALETLRDRRLITHV